MPDEAPKIHIDSDWKAEAQAEKERLAAEEKAQTAAAGPDGAGRELPPADIRALVEFVASRALLSLGVLRDPSAREIVVDLEGAKFAIDLLGVLEEKTKGNLSPEEEDELTRVAAAMRAQFVHVTDLVAQSAAAGGAPGEAGAPPEAPTDPAPTDPTLTDPNWSDPA